MAFAAQQPGEATMLPQKPDTALISRLLPDAEIRGIDKLDMGLGTYVWEIDMLADRTNPDTGGFVYLSADGQKLLNGPLMDKRSRVITTASHPAGAIDPRMSTARPPIVPPLPLSSPSATNIQAPPEIQKSAAEPGPSDAMIEQVKKAAAQRAAFYEGISKLPYISTTQGSHVVYVMFDPGCPACSKLFKQHRNIATAYDIEFRWIPIFNNEQTYPLSALIRKTFDKDNEKGKEMMSEMLTKTWKEDEHIGDIAALTAADYGLLKPAAAVFYAIAQAMPGVGTPFVMFKNADGQPDAFSGVPNISDWASLAKAE
jgi:hypothetical protein